MQEIKLSVCYIVKNEAVNLPVSLASIKEAADEIIVVDTGSTDDTREIAERFGAKVFDFRWQDDFSAPRNHAIEQARGEWILFLDADESFPMPLSREDLLKFLAGMPDTEVVLLCMHDVDSLTEQHSFSTYWIPRIFRRRADLRYKGKIHERICKAAGDLQVTYASPELYLLHTGYAKGISADKCRRDLHVLQQSIAAGEWEPGYDYYLTDCYYGLQEYEKALQHAKAFAHSGTVVYGGNGHIYRMILECMRALSLPDAEMLPWAEKACRHYPDLPEFYAERGMVLCGLGRIEEARQLLLEALRRYREGTAEAQHESYFSVEVAAKVAARLGEIAELQGEAEAAAQFFVQALDYCPDNAQVLAKAQKFLAAQEKSTSSKKF